MMVSGRLHFSFSCCVKQRLTTLAFRSLTPQRRLRWWHQKLSSLNMEMTSPRLIEDPFESSKGGHTYHPRRRKTVNTTHFMWMNLLDGRAGRWGRTGRFEQDYQFSSRLRSPSRGTETVISRPVRRSSGYSRTEDTLLSSRSSPRSSGQRKRIERSPSRGTRHKDIDRPRPVRQRSSGGEKLLESLLRGNGSRLSVLSASSRASSTASGDSNSTITQESFDQKMAKKTRPASSRPKAIENEHRLAIEASPKAELPNVFDFLQETDTADGEPRVSSPISSSSKTSTSSMSDAPDTPSSSSTFPSPRLTRAKSFLDSTTSYHVASSSVRSDTPNSTAAGLSTLEAGGHGTSASEEDVALAIRPTSEDDDLAYHPSSPSLRRSRRRTIRMREQEQDMREHMAQDQDGYFIEPSYDQHYDFAPSPLEAALPPQPYHMPLLPYHWPANHVFSPPHSPPQYMNGHISPHDIPPAPDPPDPTEKTVTGYEQLAQELATAESSIKPMYRRFNYLNHRILLHLQDELCELEEQLRNFDEVVARVEPDLPNGQKAPASRRREAAHGLEIHRQRTFILGRIAAKTKQYNENLSAYSNMANLSTLPEEFEISAYQAWLSKHSPIHDVETSFLRRKEDLILPAKESTKKSQSLQRSTRHVALVYMVVALMLPFLLYSFIPTLLGRFMVTTLIGAVGVILVASTRVRSLMRTTDWAVCGAAYILVMAVIAGCIPQY